MAGLPVHPVDLGGKPISDETKISRPSGSSPLPGKGSSIPQPGGEPQEAPIAAAKPEKGFYLAVRDLKPDRQFLVNSGCERYPMTEGLEAIGLAEMAADVAFPAA